MTGKTEAGINFSSATYDALDRILTRTYPATPPKTSPSPTIRPATATASGHLTSLTDQAGTLGHSYEERGHITTDARTIERQPTRPATPTRAPDGLTGITYAVPAGSSPTPATTPARSRPSPRPSPATARSISPPPSRICPSGRSPPDLWQRRDRYADLRSRLPHDEREGSRHRQYPVSQLWLRRGQQRHSITDTSRPPITKPSTTTSDRISSASGPYGRSATSPTISSQPQAYGATTYTIAGLSNRMSKAGSAHHLYLHRQHQRLGAAR